MKQADQEIVSSRIRTFLRSKLFRAAVAGAVTAVLLLVLAWNYALPNYRPALKDGEVYGIDVSSHQQPLDWGRVVDDDIAFAYIKATEGSGTVDPSYESHRDGAVAAGLPTGAYHFFSFCSPGKTQAENFLNVVAKDDALPAALDLEFSPFCDQYPEIEQVHTDINDFLHMVEQETGRTPLLYVGGDVNERYKIRETYGDYRYWQPRFLRRPNHDNNVIWQVGGFFYVEGAEDKIDLNLGRLEELL